MSARPGPKSKKIKNKLHKNYEVASFSNNKLILSKPSDILYKKQKWEEQIKRFKQLNNYEIDFIKYFNNDQHFIAYLSNESVLDLAIRIFERNNKSKNYVQCLNYEMYQKMDDLYLTILTFVNTELDDNPIVPLYYLVHEKNDFDTHYNFWKNFILKKLSSYRLPISYNIEDQVIKQVIIECLNNYSDCKLYFCSNNIYRNIKNYIQFNNLQLIDCSENLIEANRIHDFTTFYDESKEIWPKDYLEFFDKEIKPLILSNLKRNKLSNFNLKAINSKSTNFSINFQISKVNWLTDLISKLYKNSCEFIIKFNQLYQDDKLKIMCKYVEYFDEQNHRNLNTYLDLNFDPSINQLFHFEIADLIVRNNLIYEKEENFYVRSPFNENEYVVKTLDDEGNTECTCTMKQNGTNLCAHRIAAKIFFENKKSINNQ